MDSELTVDAVLAAIAEYDRLGKAAFLEKYGFRKARDYYLVVNGQRYDSKAIVAVAHGYLEGGNGPLNSSELSGGVAHHKGAAKLLRGLGFEVATSGENGDWTWDEHILAFDLYVQSRPSIPGKASAEIKELSALLNRLGELSGAKRTAHYRNANGVYMKLMNFKRFDPEVQAAGKAGLKQGNKLEERAWLEYGGKPTELRSEAQRLRHAIELSLSEATPGLDEYEAEEGGVVLKLHRSRERDTGLIRRKKEQALKEFGCLSCEVCSFDFTRRYGVHGQGFIEAHHRKPVSALKPGSKTRLTDLALVCANCHRMLHRARLTLGIEDLRRLLTS